MNWRDATSEIRLNRIIESLEQDAPSHQRTAVQQVLTGGPMALTDDVQQQLEDGHTPVDFSGIRAELLQYLRSVVRAKAGGVPARISTRRFIHFVGTSTTKGRVRTVIDGQLRDVAVLQLVWLVDLVGVSRLMTCGDPRCGRLFARTHRQAFCCVRHQKRMEMKRRRDRARQKRLQEQARRERRRRA